MSRRLVIALAAAAAFLPASQARANDVPIIPGGRPWVMPGELAVSPDGSALYAAGRRTVTFSRDRATGGLTLVSGLEPQSDEIVAPAAGHTVITRGEQGIDTLTLDPADGTPLHTGHLTDSDELPYSIYDRSAMLASPDGRNAYLLCGGLTVLNSSLRFVQSLLRPAMARQGCAGAFSGDGRDLYVASGATIARFARDPGTGRVTSMGNVSGPASGGVTILAGSPDGRRMYGGDQQVSAWDRDPATGSLTLHGATTRIPGYGALDVAVSPDSRHVAVVGRARGAFIFASDALGAVPKPIPGTGAPTHAVWSPDGRFLYLSGYEDTQLDHYTGRITVLAVDTTAGARVVQVVRPRVGVREQNGAPTVTINDGAQYTNTPDVMITLTAQEALGAASLTIANDGGLLDGRLVRNTESGQLLWHLEPAPLARDVRHVYVQPGPPELGNPVITDDIILDERAPVVDTATLSPLTTPVAKRRVRLKARDNRSHVAKLQLTRNRRKPGKARKYVRTLKPPKGKAKLWVRVVDGAGNHSRWHAVTRVKPKHKPHSPAKPKKHVTR